MSPESSPLRDRSVLEDAAVRSYREKLGWGKGRTPGSRLAVGPPIPYNGRLPRLNPPT